MMSTIDEKLGGGTAGRSAASADSASLSPGSDSSTIATIGGTFCIRTAVRVSSSARIRATRPDLGLPGSASCR